MLAFLVNAFLLFNVFARKTGVMLIAVILFGF